MSACRFSIAYSGEAVEDGRMSLREVAPALAAMGRVLDGANSTLNGNTAKLDIHITAISAGSFEVALELAQNLTSEALDLLTSDPAANAATVLTALFAAGGGLVWLVKKLGGKKISKSAEQDDGTVEITLETKERIKVSQDVLKLYENADIRRSLSGILRPLRSEGITSFHARGGDQIESTVNESDVDCFDFISEEDGCILDDTRTQIYGIASVAFKEGNKWRLLDGQTPIHASIRDQAFLERVACGETNFASGDMLKCEMKVKQRLMEDGRLQTTYAVMRVIDHFRKPSAPELWNHKGE